MAQIKKTKIELKSRRDTLSRFERFLPMLQLKKQQLQVERQAVQQAIEQNRAAAETLIREARAWIALLPENGARLPELVRAPQIRLSEANIAGVVMPVFESVDFTRAELDLFDSPPWMDEAQALIGRLAETRLRGAILDRQAALLDAELRTTSQRVNLFEKVKIPESRDAIRVIKIFLGDQMTADVARGKAAKKVSQTAVQELGT